MFIKANHKAIRYTGRWGKTDFTYGDMEIIRRTSVNPGSMFEIAFRGSAIVLHFDLDMMNLPPFPHLWIQVDDGAKTEVTLDHVIRVEASGDGEHLIRVIFKSAVEAHHRWYEPLVGKVTFEGADVIDVAELPQDNRKIIEFIGDSITEGVLIDEFYKFEKVEQHNRVRQDDSTATYAYLTAMKLNMRPVIVGFGAVGVTHSGQGAVPKAGESYPYNYSDSPAEPSGAEVIVINHGVNDRYAETNVFTEGYVLLLDEVRKLNPDAKIVLLTPFADVHTEDVIEIAKKYNEDKNDNLTVINSAGWIPVDPLHPLRDGHITIAEHLAEELKKILDI